MNAHSNSQTQSHRRPSLVQVFVACTIVLAPLAHADEGGASFWLPGQQGSMAAAPGAPGWNLPLVYYHIDAGAGAAQNFEIGGRITADLNAQGDLIIFAPSYALKTPVAGGQLSLGLGAYVGRLDVDVAATLSGTGGGVISGRESASVTGMGDAFANATLKWNRGVHNRMLYASVGMPTGSYELGRLANLSLNHWSFDTGGGYTYFNPAKGHEFSAVLGFTFSGENEDTQYKNGTSAHLDWAASQFLSEKVHVGIAGYFYQQLEGDSGAGASLGPFKSQVNGIGPQVGYLFPMGGKTAYFNAKSYYEFNAKNRPEGWNVWLTLAIPLGGAQGK